MNDCGDSLLNILGASFRRRASYCAPASEPEPRAAFVDVRPRLRLGGRST